MPTAPVPDPSSMTRRPPGEVKPISSARCCRKCRRTKAASQTTTDSSPTDSWTTKTKSDAALREQIHWT